jgi:hypothetical protein
MGIERFDQWGFSGETDTKPNCRLNISRSTYVLDATRLIAWSGIFYLVHIVSCLLITNSQTDKDFDQHARELSLTD